MRTSQDHKELLTIDQASDSQVELFPFHHADEWGRKSED